MIRHTEPQHYAHSVNIMEQHVNIWIWRAMQFYLWMIHVMEV